jgi:hypothetical protein
MPQAAQTASADPDVSVTWASSGRPFDGWLLVGLVVPSGYPRMELYNYIGLVDLPIFTMIPIVAGQYNQNTQIFYTDMIDPPGATYVGWLVDKGYKQIGSVSSPFTVTSNPFTPPNFTVTDPSAGTNPVPNF